MFYWVKILPYAITICALTVLGLSLFNWGKTKGTAVAQVECIKQTEQSAQKSEKSYDKNLRDARQIKDRDAAIRELSDLGILRESAG